VNGDSALQVQLGSKLGAGTFGAVHYGWAKGTLCAVKTVEVAASSPFFLRELAALARLRHKNVVEFRGGSLPRSLLACSGMTALADT